MIRSVRDIEVHDGTHHPLSVVARQDGTELSPRVDHRPDRFTGAEACQRAAGTGPTGVSPRRVMRCMTRCCSP
ncbi:hypothetical protein GCM10010145_42740 [Streptomyces ruber]|uniref:Uncharacterized protein n=1 Tax=Streptomyces ruber TaxID=83378 RepID=A0A918BHD8_9ACTN|nr:hypothetical protein GCM10010145_42740 [Streptomyces ruber]